jgi:hypothetical protein
MTMINDALKVLKTLKPPRIAAGLEINKITEPVTPLDVWGLIEAVRLFVDLTQDHRTALERLKEFVTNPRPMKFTRLNRAQVSLQALARLLNHSLINQKTFGLCGPAAIAMETAASRPIEYIKLVSFLCDDGACLFRHLMLKPGPAILAYDPDGEMPQADWVVCASLRNDDESLQEEFSKETYGGTTVGEVYEWMIKAGYRKVIGVCTKPLAHFCKTHPSTLKPPVLKPDDKLTALRIAVDLSESGWHVFLGGYSSLAKSIESLHFGQNLSAESEEPTILENARAAESVKLMSKTPGAWGVARDAAKMVVLKKAPADIAHWMYVEKMKPSSVHGGYLTVTCCSYGVRYSSVNVPFEGFANKAFGYVAVTDLG